MANLMIILSLKDKNNYLLVCDKKEKNQQYSFKKLSYPYFKNPQRPTWMKQKQTASQRRWTRIVF